MVSKECCLTCLGTNKDKRHVDAVILIAGDNVRLSDILKSFYDYELQSDEEIPTHICINCVHQLTMTYSFKVLIDSCAKKLHEKLTDTEYLNEADNDDTYPTEEEEEKYEVKSELIKLEHPPIRKYKKTVTESEKTLFCVECKNEYNNAQALKEHCKNNHPVKSPTGRDCSYCFEKFDDLHSLALHRKLHLRPYICESCWEGFYNHEELNLHICIQKDRDKTEKPDKVLRQCDQCGKSYPPSYIRIHMLTHSEDRPYSCKYCPKKFKVPGGLHSHVLWNHKRTRNHKCEICNATFISSSSRSSHIRKNHLKEKKYPCKCGKRFFSKSELERHMLTHTGVKNFHCHLCDKSYQTRYGLNVHLKSHNQINNMTVLNL